MTKQDAQKNTQSTGVAGVSNDGIRARRDQLVILADTEFESEEPA